MPPVKIERIVSVSSEDEVHPASNLLKLDYSNKKWKCKSPGEKQISIVFQLAQFCRIHSIDIGNEHSAFIEVLVGKSCSSNDDFKILLVTSSLMTLQESKYGTNVNGVSFFKEESLCKPVCEEKWDRIKVVCTQPFNKNVQFGLSFIIFHTPQSDPSESVNLQVKATGSVEPLLKVGGLFANRKKLSNGIPASGAAAIRAASADIKIDQSAPNSDNAISSRSPQVSSNNKEGKKKQDTKKEKANTPKNGKKAGTVKGNGRPPKKKIILAPVQAFKKREERPFCQLMNGVVFAMSGYENPLRSELRNKALAMGAKYEFNWNCNCTHLICAFKNTPKYNQVRRGHGKIIKSQWIEECYSRRKRLPWRRFALDRNDASQAESEEEIHELIDRPLATAGSACRESSEEEAGDTDDEIEKVRKNQGTINVNNDLNFPSTSGGICIQNSPSNGLNQIKLNNISENDAKDTFSSKANERFLGNYSNASKIETDSLKKEEINVFDMDTESENENYWVKSTPEECLLPSLPAFLEGTTIALLDDLSESDKKLLTRYIKAHKGAVADDTTDLNAILFAITEDLSAIERIREDFPQVIGVIPEWMWRSHDEGKILPASLYQVQ